MQTLPQSLPFPAKRLLAFLDTLDASPPQEALTLVLPPGQPLPPPKAVDLEHREWLEEIACLTDEKIQDSETGSIAFWSHNLKAMVLPPFPLETYAVANGLDTTPLRGLFAKKRTVGVVLLRLGRFSVGVFHDDQLLASKTDTRYVKGRHKAGGTSQRRFARIREQQIHLIFLKACHVTQEKLGPYQQELEKIFLGGERHTLTDFLKACPFLQRQDHLIAKRLLPIDKPRHRELETMPREIWKSQVHLHAWPQDLPLPGSMETQFT
jgi:hypothetical protein